MDPNESMHSLFDPSRWSWVLRRGAGSTVSGPLAGVERTSPAKPSPAQPDIIFRLSARCAPRFLATIGCFLPEFTHQIRGNVRQVWRSRPCRSEVYYNRNQWNEGRAMKAEAPTITRRPYADSQRAAQDQPTARIDSRRASLNLKEKGTRGSSAPLSGACGSRVRA